MMSIGPAVPFSGLIGLRFIDQTYDRQFERFGKSPEIRREIAYFLETAGNIKSLDHLMADRRVLGVILGAFGLDEDLDKRAFVRKVLEEGTLRSDSFANRLVEPAYREMSSFLGFGSLGGTLGLEGRRMKIVEMFQERQFERAVGEVDVDLRLALNFRREAVEIAASDSPSKTQWLQFLGSSPLREVLEAALGLPKQFASAGLDQQVDEVSRRARSLFGIEAPVELTNAETLDAIVDRFLLNRQIAGGTLAPTARGAVALSLLQSSTLGAAASQNLFASAFV